MREFLTATDRRLSKLLSGNAQKSINQLAEEMQLSAPTVRGRMRALVEKNFLKIVGRLNLCERPELIGAFVGLNTNCQGDLDSLMKKICKLPFVSSVSTVTGRFDLIVEVLVAGDVQDLYRFTSELLPRVADPGVISRSETFVIMKSQNKWVGLTQGCWEADAEAASCEPHQVLR